MVPAIRPRCSANASTRCSIASAVVAPDAVVVIVPPFVRLVPLSRFAIRTFIPAAFSRHMSVPRVARKRDGSVVRLDRFPLNALSLALLLGPPWPRAAVAHAVMMPLTAALEVGVIVVGSESTSSDRNQQGGMEMRPSTREAPSSLGRGDSNPTVLRPPAPQ